MQLEFEQVQEQLARIRPELPPKLKRAAEFALQHPEEIAVQPMRKVANDCGVTIPNLSRLAKVVGFEKYNELRAVYRDWLLSRNTVTSYPGRADLLQGLGKKSSNEAIWSVFRTSALDTLESTFQQVDAKKIESIVDRLLTKDRVHLVGLQASHSFATYLKYVGKMVSPKFTQLSTATGLVSDDLIDVRDSDALLCIALQPCANGTVKAAKLAYERGLFVVGVTDSRASPLASYSSDLLLTSCESPLFFESYIGITAIVELLIGFITLRSSSAVVARIEQIEHDRRLMGEYWEADKDE